MTLLSSLDVHLDSLQVYNRYIEAFYLQVESLQLEKRSLDRRLEFSQEEIAECERQLKKAQVTFAELLAN